MEVGGLALSCLLYDGTGVAEELPPPSLGSRNKLQLSVNVMDTRGVEAKFKAFLTLAPD